MMIHIYSLQTWDPPYTHLEDTSSHTILPIILTIYHPLQIIPVDPMITQPVHHLYLYTSSKGSVQIVVFNEVERKGWDRGNHLLSWFSSYSSYCCQNTTQYTESYSGSHKIYNVGVPFASLLRNKGSYTFMEFFSFHPHSSEGWHDNWRKRSFFHLNDSLIVITLFLLFMLFKYLIT